MKRLTLISLCVLFVGGTTLADWAPTDPAKWVQLPDLSPTGIDVYATAPKVLADDFLCTQTELITDIHIWGSWLGRYLPNEPAGGNPSASNVTFTLSLHADIPADEPGGPGYSMPGTLLWEHIFNPGEFGVNLYSVGPEGWYNPNTGEYIVEGDHQAWQYNFYIDPRDAFMQEGTPGDPIVYWLDVSATPSDDQAFFGWKTSMEHWNDDAVWADSPKRSSLWRRINRPCVCYNPRAGNDCFAGARMCFHSQTKKIVGFSLLVLTCKKKGKSPRLAFSYCL